MNAAAVSPIAGAHLQLPDPNRSLSELAVGAHLSGQVLARGEGGRGEIVLLGFGRFTASVPPDLSIGDWFVARLDANTAPFRLRLLDRAAGADLSAVIRRAFAVEGGVAPSLRLLLEAYPEVATRVPSFRRWVLGAGETLDAERLEKAIASLSDPVEARIHRAALAGRGVFAPEGDLAAELRAALDALGRTDRVEAAQQLRALLAEADAAQVLRALAQLRGEGLVIGLPLLVDRDESFLQLRVRPDGKGGEGAETGVDFDVRVELSALGAVRTQGHLAGTQLRARVELESAEAVAALAAAGPELVEALARAGFPQAVVEFEHAAVPDRRNWLAGVLPPANSLVNLRA